MITSKAHSSLASLAERMGVEQEFEDARGRTVHTTATTNCKLLHAMGAAVANDADASEVLDGLDRAEWLRPLPPVRVVRSRGTPGRY